MTRDVAGSSLADPLAVGRTILTNRLGFGPVNPGLSNAVSGRRRSALLDFYGQYARSGIGLVYIGGVAVSPSGRSNRGSLVMYDSSTTQLVAGVSETLRRHGTKLAVQLMHAGRQSSEAEIGCRPVAASGIPCPYYKAIPRAASIADLRQIVGDFVRASRFATEAGADLVEIHAAHGYLLSGFLSASSNVRTDAYGGSVRNRFRLLTEVVQAIRNDGTVPALGVRVNVRERLLDTVTVDETIAGLGSIAGELDFLSVTAGVYTESTDLVIPARAIGTSAWRHEAARIRAELGLPTFLAGNITGMEIAADLVGSGSADVSLLVRSLLADPDLFRKWQAGETDIQPCTELYLCKYHSRGASHVYCPYNPVLREHLLPKVSRRIPTQRSETLPETDDAGGGRG
jgi:2,4-dienoyl-CoA reductase-like NADH-dependent reductase (Old Yellow Enzyme family)